MSQQVLDLRSSIQAVRRHRVLLGILVAVGILVGAGYSVVYPPMLTSTALVVLPGSAQSSAGAAADTGPDSYIATQVVIAESSQVLAGALPDVRPAMSLGQLRHEVQVEALTASIISISANGRTAADAAATANALVDSYIAYVNSANSPVGRVAAGMLEPATSASGRGLLEALIITGLLGALGGALVGVLVSLAISRNDKRLWARDEIANSVGIPVLTSFPAARPSDAAGWTRLLYGYKPGVVQAWQLRKALQQLEVPDSSLKNGLDGGGFSLAVVSLSSDRGALAIGPQLAVFAASLEIPTALIIAPSQDVNVTAALHTACAVSSAASQKRPSHLRVSVSDDGQFDGQPDASLTVIVAVVDSQTPQMPDTIRTRATVLGVSAGAATSEQLARVAMSAAVDGREITGILVANPEPTDPTTGRVPRLTRPTRRRLPTRLNGMTTEIRR